MSKDIWHTADEIPDFDKSYVELSRSLQGDLVYSTWGHPNYITPNTIKWCYMDDLLALETENKDLSDKIRKLETDLERTRKALDVALDALKEITNNDYDADWQNDLAQATLEKIKDIK
jgi:phage-related minor tail protein